MSSIVSIGPDHSAASSRLDLEDAKSKAGCSLIAAGYSLFIGTAAPAALIVGGLALNIFCLAGSYLATGSAAVILFAAVPIIAGVTIYGAAAIAIVAAAVLIASLAAALFFGVKAAYIYLTPQEPALVPDDAWKNNPLFSP